MFRRIATVAICLVLLISMSSLIGTEFVSAQQVDLRFMIPEGGGRGPGFSAVVDLYQELNPDVEIEIYEVPFGEFSTLVPVLLAGDNPPDVMLISSSEIQFYAYNEALLPLNDLYSAEDIEDFVSSLVAEVTYQGQMYGGPFFISTQGVFYNKDLFAAAGVEAPQKLEEAWTWPEFVENVSRIVKQQKSVGKDIWGLVYLSNPPQSTWALPVIRSAGTPGSPTFMAISDDKTEVLGYLDTPEAIEGYRFWQDLYNKWNLAPRADVPDAFGVGNAATAISFSAWGSVLDTNFPDLNWGIMPLPYLNSPIAHSSHMVPTVAAKSRHADEAKAFVEFLTSRDGFMAYYSVTSDMPARTSLLMEIPVFQERPLNVLTDTLIEIAQPNPGGPGGAIYNQIVTRMLVDIAKGADVDATVQSAVWELDAQLEQFRY